MVQVPDCVQGNSFSVLRQTFEHVLLHVQVAKPAGTVPLPQARAPLDEQVKLHIVSEPDQCLSPCTVAGRPVSDPSLTCYIFTSTAWLKLLVM